MSRVGIVIPSILNRPDYLLEAIQSIRQAGDVFVLLCTPDDPDLVSNFVKFVDDHRVEEPKGNLAEKINQALKQLPSDCEFIGWLGDDDLLTVGAMDRAVRILDESPETVFVYGACNYIDENGSLIGRNPSGNWARALMHFGPFLIPQPGSLWRRSTFESVGGLSKDYQLAFDHDLFLRLSKHGKGEHTQATQASFRWHPGSLSVRRRWTSVREASMARVANYPTGIKLISILWEPYIILSTYLAGRFVSLLVRHRAKKG